MEKSRWVSRAIVVALVIAVAPQAGAAERTASGAVTATASPQPEIMPRTPQPEIMPRTPLPRIASRREGLYNAASGAAFVSRGTNYVRLATNAAGQVYHSTFEPGQYDRARVIAFLEQMKHDGYNTVRVFIDPGTNGGDHGIGRGLGTYHKVYPPYMDNVADFVREAAARGIYTIPSLDMFPTNSYYWELAGRENGSSTPNMAGRNLSYLDKGRVAAKAEYMANFAAALIERLGAERSTAILAYQSDNEVYFEANKAPYHRMSGTVTPLNGVTYDMSDTAQRQQSADASLVEYTRRVNSRLVAADPDALLTVGFFSYQAVGKTGADGFSVHCDTNCSPNVDYRYPLRAGVLSYWGAVDILDLHMYAHHGAPVLNAHAMSSRRDPYIIGEFGALRSRYNNDVRGAAYAMRDMQREMCGLGAQGYLFWTWDTTERLASQELFFQMAEQHGAINGQLAPIVRPDPCR
jgi:hypothetical protein